MQGDGGWGGGVYKHNHITDYGMLVNILLQSKVSINLGNIIHLY
jgi:hypothetical protein